MVIQKMIGFIRYTINRCVGFDIVRVSGQHNLTTHLMAVLDHYRIDAVIDVGASEGGFGKLLRGIKFKGEIFSFEPVLSSFNSLQQAASKDADWFVFRLALGDSEGNAEINVSKFNQLSSFLPSSEYGNTWSGMNVVEQQKVEIATIGGLLARGILPKGKRYLLKMDTQGYDLKVFDGALTALPNICCILTELSLVPLYEDMPSYKAALTVYEAHGFSVTGFYPITRQRNLVLKEVDCMLVNSTLRD